MQKAQHTADFFSAGGGGPAQYSGKDMIISKKTFYYSHHTKYVEK